jgi:signal transduction histidine kinase
MNEAHGRPPAGTLPIRQWVAVAFGVVFFVPVFLTAVFVFHLSGQPTAPWDRAGERLADDLARWEDPTWQAAIRDDLDAEGVDVVLLQDGREIFSTTADPLSVTGDDGQVLVQRFSFADGGATKAAYVYAVDGWWTPTGSNPFLVPAAAVSSLLLTIACSAWFLGRTVVRPLAAASDAARRIAAGDLDVDLPPSRVSEVAELNAAFEGMSAELPASLRHQAELEQERRLPLFSLRGYLEGLGQGLADTPEKAARYVAVAREKAAALERLIADLFDFTRLEYLDQTPNREPLDLAALLRRLVDGVRPQAEAKGVRWTFDAPPTPIVVDGDGYQLTRAIENLLDNAVRYTPNGGEVRVSCRDEAEVVTFTVSDTGPGIPLRDLPHLFTPLYRGETSRNRKTGGAGLGLATAQRILRAHGGDLVARNGPVAGALFVGRVPRAEHRPPATDVEAPAFVGTHRSSAIPTPFVPPVGRGSS